MLPFIAFCVFLDHLVALFQQFFQIAGEVEVIDELAYAAVFGFEGKQVDHKRTIFDLFEMVFVFHAFEIAFFHFVGEGEGPVHVGDLHL